VELEGSLLPSQLPATCPSLSHIDPVQILTNLYGTTTTTTTTNNNNNNTYIHTRKHTYSVFNAPIGTANGNTNGRKFILEISTRTNFYVFIYFLFVCLFGLEDKESGFGRMCMKMDESRSK